MSAANMESAIKGVKVRYIGHKPKKTDNVTGSDTVWTGNGDIQIVPVAVAARLLTAKYGGIWQDAALDAPVANDPAKITAGVRAAVTTYQKKMDLKPQRPEGEEERIPPEDIIDSIAELALGEDAATHFDNDQRPKLESVREKLGKRISQKALTEAWDLMKSQAA